MLDLRSQDAWTELEQALDEAERDAQAWKETAQESEQLADEWESKADMYRKQLGGTNAALNRSRQREADLEAILMDAYQAHLFDLRPDFVARMKKLGLLEGVVA